MSVYPKNLAINLSSKPFDSKKTIELKNNLPNNLIIRVYGLAGVGKGTLSKSLADTLGIPNIESSFILRCATHIFQEMNLDFSKENIDKVFAEFKVSTDQSGLVFDWKGKKISDKELKTPKVDELVPVVAQIPHVREKFDTTLDNVVLELNKPLVADGRGSHEPYLVKAEKRGWKVVRLLLDASDEIKADRYLAKYLSKHPNLNSDQKEDIIKEFKKTVVERNHQDVKNILDKNLGLISEDSGFIDTSNMSPQEVLETALNFVQESL